MDWAITSGFSRVDDDSLGRTTAIALKETLEVQLEAEHLIEPDCLRATTASEDVDIHFTS